MKRDFLREQLKSIGLNDEQCEAVTALHFSELNQVKTKIKRKAANELRYQAIVSIMNTLRQSASFERLLENAMDVYKDEQKIKEGINEG